MAEQNQTINFKGPIRRRKKLFILTFLIVFFTAAIVAYTLPPVYQSQATILVEEQKIPRDYVKSTINSLAEERIEGIRQQVLSRQNLTELATRYDLYPNMRDSHSIEEITQETEKNISLETISTKVIDKRTGKFKSMTIAFTLSYQGHDPQKTKSVVNELASLFVTEESKEREKYASNTTTFVQEELDELKKRIEVQENKISKFKAKYVGELPENVSSNLNAIRRLERDLDATNSRIISLQETKILLEGQLANVEPLTPIVIDGEKVAMNPKERLKSLYIQLTSLQATLSDKHPDVKKLKREIHELEEKVGKSDASVAKIKKLNELQVQLSELKGKLGDKHPDVKKLENEVQLLSEEVDNVVIEKEAMSVSNENPDNPAYITLKSRIIATSAELKHLSQEKNRLNQQIEQYQKKIEKAPVLDKEYQTLMRDYDIAKKKYNELFNNLMEVKASQELVAKEQGEKFSIVDTANLPKKPFKPNRLGIILLGFVLSIGAGFGISAIRETMDNSIKSTADIQSLTKAPVLSVISVIETDKEKWASRFKNILWLLVIICVIAAALYYVDMYVIKLDQLWAIFIERSKTMI